MPTQDTIKLLNECNAGIKMAVESLDEVINKAKNEKLITLLKNSLEEHKKLGNLTHQKLNEFHDKDKEPSTIAKAMSWMSTNLKLLTGDVDEKIANAQLGGGAITMFSMEIVNGDLIVNYPDESNNNVDFEINNYGELEVIINE